MEINKRDDEFSETLMFVLKKITDSNIKILDNIYLEKLLQHIKCECGEEYENYTRLSGLSNWLIETLNKWKKNPPNIYIGGFFCQFVGLISNNEPGFEFIQKSDIINELIDVYSHDLLKNTTIKVTLIKLLTDFLNHHSGYNWIVNSHQWKIVIRTCFSDSSLYVSRESLVFIKKLITKAKFNDFVIEEILQEILLPISKNELKEMEHKNIFFKMCLSFKLLEGILREYMFVNDNKICLKLTKIFDLQLFLKSLLENCEDETIRDSASTLLVTFIVLQFKDKQELVTTEQISFNIIDIFHILLKKNYTENIIKLAKFCQILWNEIKNKLNCPKTTGVQFIILQLVPVLAYLKQPGHTKMFDLFIQKLFAMASSNVLKLGYALRDAIRGCNNSKPRDWALKSVSSAIGNLETLNNDEAVLIFQCMTHVSKVFVHKNGYDEEFLIAENLNFQKDPSIFNEDITLLSAVLNSLCLLIEKFKINWTESLESLCLLKITCALLGNSQLASVVVVQTLLLVKLAILNFMSPNLALLLNHSEDSSFECLIPLLYKRMHDPNWEIRDSCIEVVTAIAELAESKYPAFQQLLVEKDFCSLVFNILEGDSESYVRASALKALSAMTKIETLSQYLFKLDFPLKIIKLLQTESEGIVRREAALIIKQIYLGLNEPNKLFQSLYQIMGYSAICDLHWEVKVNSLLFWEAVIQRVISDQGMIDGSFPKVTFSKEHKKIVMLTNDEIKLRLDKVLKELSKIGCLFVLITTLNDDCDLPVVEKSAQILTDFVNVLKRYKVIKSNTESICDRISLKRKNPSSNNCEKRKAPNDDDGIILPGEFDLPINSDAIIEEIVNEMDINLLVSVYQPKEENGVVQKKILLQEIKPEAFLLQMKGFDSDKFLKDKQKWFTNVEIDLKSIINDIITIESKNETNLLDCY